MLRDTRRRRTRGATHRGILAVLLLLALTLMGCGADGAPAADATEDGEDTTSQEEETDDESDTEDADYPTQNITLIVPYSAGGGTDVLGRKLAPMLEERLGVSVIVENQAGGQTVPALNNVLADPSGHTLILEGALIAGLSARDIADIGPDHFAAVAIPQADPMALAVRADSEWDTLEAFAEAADANPGSLQVATSAAGGVNHAAMTLLAQSGLAIDVVPFSEGEADAINAFLAGDVDAVAIPPQGIVDFVESGDARVLGVGSEERAKALPDVPTFTEAGFDGPSIKAFRVILTHPDISAGALSVLEDAFRSVMEDEEFQQFLDENGYAYTGLGPDESASFLAEQVELYHSIYASE